MHDQQLIPTFVLYVQALGHEIQGPEQLYNGIAIAQFLASAEGSHIGESSIRRRPIDQKAIQNNFILIDAELHRFKKTINPDYQLPYCLEQIYMDQNQAELAKMLKQCILYATKSLNYTYFIEKILTLPENSQLILAELLKSQGDRFSTPVLDNPESEKNDSRQFQRGQALDLIDRLYQMQVQNQRLQAEVKRLQSENDQVQEANTELVGQLKKLKQQNQELKSQLLDHNERLDRMGSPSGKQDKQAGNLEQSQLVVQYRETMAQLQKQVEQLTRKQNQKEKQYQREIAQLRDHNARVKQELEYAHSQLQNLVRSCQQYEGELKQARKSLTHLQQLNTQLSESDHALKLELSHKQTQIDQLREMLINGSNVTDSKSELDELAELKSSKMLTTDFMPALVSPRSSSTFKVDSEELRGLRAEVKELQRENEKLKKLKSKNKQLEYEKTKLMKILKDYEMSRGEENDIITGCLYELQLRVQSNKSSQAGSTIANSLCTL